jgi:hypothetical protein
MQQDTQDIAPKRNKTEDNKTARKTEGEVRSRKQATQVSSRQIEAKSGQDMKGKADGRK